MIRKPGDELFHLYFGRLCRCNVPNRDISRKTTIFKIDLAEFIPLSVSRTGVRYRSHVQWTGAAW